MREYKIKETKLGYNVLKLDREHKRVLYWTGKLWSHKKAHAKTYITQDDAISALVLSKRQEGVEDFWQS